MPQDSWSHSKLHKGLSREEQEGDGMTKPSHRCMQALAPGSDTSLDAAALEAIAGEAPSATLPRDEVVGTALAEVAVAAGLQPSKGATRRLIKVCDLGSVDDGLDCKVLKRSLMCKSLALGRVCASPLYNLERFLQTEL